VVGFGASVVVLAVEVVMRGLVVCAWMALVLGAAAPAFSGAPARCAIRYTPEVRVAGARHIVVVRAVSATRASGERDGLRTQLEVVRVLKGELGAGQRFVLGDCGHWKCAGARFAKGDEVLLFLGGEPPHVWIDHVSCAALDPKDLVAGGLKHDLSDPVVRAVYAAAGVVLGVD
jgi:hypothetical protein